MEYKDYASTANKHKSETFPGYLEGRNHLLCDLESPVPGKMPGKEKEFRRGLMNKCLEQCLAQFLVNVRLNYLAKFSIHSNENFQATEHRLLLDPGWSSL